VTAAEVAVELVLATAHDASNEVCEHIANDIDDLDQLGTVLRLLAEMVVRAHRAGAGGLPFEWYLAIISQTVRNL
jgi:hypothetical protein